jgi:hypothetical protein
VAKWYGSSLGPSSATLPASQTTPTIPHLNTASGGVFTGGFFGFGTLDEQRRVTRGRNEEGLLIHKTGHGKQSVGELAHVEGGEELGFANRVRVPRPLDAFKLLDKVAWAKSISGVISKIYRRKSTGFQRLSLLHR